MSAPGLKRENGPDDRAARDPRVLEIRERAHRRAVFDDAARADHDMGLDHHVAADLGVERQEHGLGRGQRRAADHGAAAQPVLHRGFCGGELGAIVDAHDLALVCDQGARDKAAGVGDLDDVGEVIFLLRVVGLDRVEKAQRVGAPERDRPGVAQA